MPYSLKDKLVVGVASRALFDLSAENEVFETRGLAAYRELQAAHEDEPLRPGTAFPIVKGLLAINRRARRRVVEVVVLSRNDAETGLRVFNSIGHHGLDIERGVFRGGRDPWPYLGALNCSLFLTQEPRAVVEALNAHIPAALALKPPGMDPDEEATEVRIAFDGDAVLFGGESEDYFQQHGLDAFHDYERDFSDEPMNPGPFAPFLRALRIVQDEFPDGESPIRTALVTARGAPAHARVIKTLRAWGVHVDESFFLGGVEKRAVLEVFRPHIFFDDQLRHLESAQETVPSAHVIRAPHQGELFPDLPDADTAAQPLVVLPGTSRGSTTTAASDNEPADEPTRDALVEAS